MNPLVASACISVISPLMKRMVSMMCVHCSVSCPPDSLRCLHQYGVGMPPQNVPLKRMGG